MDGVGTKEPAALAQLKAHMIEGLVGHEILIERLLIGLLTGGHVLIEGAPGLAKTRAVKLLAQVVDGSFARIQSTPDLLPSDITGTPVFRPQDGRFEFVPGPIFHNLVLVDEINRAPPKVQSALLEAMGEGQVTIANDTHTLPRPFVVVATQNPIEHEGTFPLPEAQLDRFLLYTVLPMPELSEERQILDLVETELTSEPHEVVPISLSALETLRGAVNQVYLAPELRDYIARLVVATRHGDLAKDIAYPVSPRGSLALAAAAKARAFLHGRDHARPEDVAALAEDALAHRLGLTWQAVASGVTPREVVARIVAEIAPL